MSGSQLNLAALRCAAVTLALLAAPALAQLTGDPRVDLQQFDMNSGADASLAVGTGEMLPPGSFNFSLAGEYENNPLRYLENGDVIGSIITNRYTFHLLGVWAPFEWFQLGVDVPIVAAQDGIDLRNYGIPNPVDRGIGSPTVSARLRLLSQAGGSPLNVAVHLGVRPPLGSDGAWMREERTMLSPKLMLGRNFGSFAAGMEVGLRWRPGTGTVIENLSDQVQLAGVISSGPRNGLRLEISARGAVDQDGRRGPVEVLAGARFPLGIMELFALAGPGLGEEPGSRTWRVLMGASFGSLGGLAGTTDAPEVPVDPGALVPPGAVDIPVPSPESAPTPQAAPAPAPAS